MAEAFGDEVPRSKSAIRSVAACLAAAKEIAVSFAM